jgi:hypothetical protein
MVRGRGCSEMALLAAVMVGGLGTLVGMLL